MIRNDAGSVYTSERSHIGADILHFPNMSPTRKSSCAIFFFRLVLMDTLETL